MVFVTAFFVNFFMHSPKGYLNGQRLSALKTLSETKISSKWDTTGIPFIFVQEFPLGGIPVYGFDFIPLLYTKKLSLQGKKIDTPYWGIDLREI